MIDRMAHYLAPLGTDRLPRAHAFLDCEARSAGRGKVLQQTWLCGALECWTTVAREGVRERYAGTFENRAELWEHLLAFASKQKRTVVWCHNVGYDLRISGALRELPARGFRLQGIVLERTAAWASFAAPGCTILFCDLASWVPAPLATIGADIGLPKLAEGPATGALRHQLKRCKRDVEITRTAVLRVLAWLESEHLGPFRPTGAGQSHAAYRRRFLTERVLVHEDTAALEAERQAMHTGRAEAWQHGRLARGPFYEFDLELAYAHIAASEQLPAVLLGEVRNLRAASYDGLRSRFRLLCDVEIETDVECVPCPLPDRVLWPVGRFRTSLWNPEVDLALEAGAQVRFERIRMYKPKPLLRDFAAWVIGLLAQPPELLDPVLRRVLKHWSRTLVGRMALRYRAWEEWGETDRETLSLGVVLDAESGHLTELMQVGRDVFELGQMLEADSSLPQVTGYVMSESRRRLWRLMQMLPAGSLAYVDTDSLIVDQAGAGVLDRAIAAGEAYSLRRKGRFDRLTIRGPRNLDLERSSRISGVPRKATRIGELEWEGEVWRSLRESVARGELESVATTARTFQPLGRDIRRRHGPGGATEPFRVERPA